MTGHMRYEELDQETRRWMLEEFGAEEAGEPYRSPSLSAKGREAFGEMMREAITSGTEESLAAALKPKELWAEYEPSPLGGIRKTEPARAAVALARSEFNTWYIRGLCRRLMEEGETYLQIYRAADADAPGDQCVPYQNMVLEIRHVYNGHRAKYWPVKNDRVFSVPCGPPCRHTVRRISSSMKAMIELEAREFGAAFRRPGP
ncbi:MAG: hypothetical protein ISF22_03775 [Methanomassiliicoccus sp.]|nr:hypothetical protein [Methanomassiliicoccus sp.]